MENLFNFTQWSLYMGTWITAWAMLFYGAVAGIRLALRDKKTNLQKVFVLCGTGIMVMMAVLSK